LLLLLLLLAVLVEFRFPKGKVKDLGRARGKGTLDANVGFELVAVLEDVDDARGDEEIEEEDTLEG
jgi:hypothetical protein